MDRLRSLLAGLRRFAAPATMGLVLVLYLPFAFIIWQEVGRQAGLATQIAKLSSVISRPLAGTGQLREQLDEADRALAPLTDVDAINTVVGIAEKHGIDVSPESGKIAIPSPAMSGKTVGRGDYQVLSFKGVSVSGDRDSVMAFLAGLDSGGKLETMALTRLQIWEVEVVPVGEGEPVIETHATMDIEIVFKSQEGIASGQ